MVLNRSCEPSPDVIHSFNDSFNGGSDMSHGGTRGLSRRAEIS
jgi:hypothetical protein